MKRRHSLLSRSSQGWRELQLPVLPFPIISCDQVSSFPFKNYSEWEIILIITFSLLSRLRPLRNTAPRWPPKESDRRDDFADRDSLINSLDDVMTGKLSSPVPTLIHLSYYPAKSQQSPLQNLQGSTLGGWIRLEFEFPPDTKLFNEPFNATSELGELRLQVFSAAAC